MLFCLSHPYTLLEKLLSIHVHETDLISYKVFIVGRQPNKKTPLQPASHSGND
jgi:hypothetical protein